MPFDPPFDNDEPVNTDEQKLKNKQDSERKDKYTSFAKETLLELIQDDKGRLLLKDMNGEQDPLVTIDFSDKIKGILGHDTQLVGHHMIHAAIQVVMQKQLSQWHAHVYDDEPEHYS